MKTAALLIMLFIVPCSTLHSMWIGFGSCLTTGQYTGKSFDRDYARENLEKYHSLYNYLAEWVDLANQNSLGSRWHGILLNFEKYHAFLFIEKYALESGNIVCLYLHARNYFKHFDNLEFDPLQPGLFVVMMLLLMRVTYDIIHHYSIFKDSSVFMAYSIFKQKMQYFLSYYLPKVPLEEYPVIQDTINQALLHWHQKFTYKQQSFSCIWLRSFGWAHSWTPGSMGICFNEDNYMDAGRAQTSTVDPKKTLTIFSQIFNSTKNRTLTSWQNFFKNNDCFLTEDNLKTFL